VAAFSQACGHADNFARRCSSSIRVYFASKPRARRILLAY
jgi:hypothetical protein